MRKIVGILTISSIFVGGCKTLTVVAIGARVIQAAKLVQTIGRDKEPTLVSAENRGLTGYELEKERQARVNKKYNELMQMIDEKEIKRGIARFGDYEFGDKTGSPGGVEIDKAYQAFLKRWESERFKRNLSQRPFVQILKGYKAY